MVKYSSFWNIVLIYFEFDSKYFTCRSVFSIKVEHNYSPIGEYNNYSELTIFCFRFHVSIEKRENSISIKFKLKFFYKTFQPSPFRRRQNISRLSKICCCFILAVSSDDLIKILYDFYVYIVKDEEPKAHKTFQIQSRIPAWSLARWR